MAVFSTISEFEQVNEFRVAEVISVETGSYQIEIKTWEFNKSQEIPTKASPISTNFLQMPVPGELVFVFQGVKPETNTTTTTYEWYYLPPFPVRTNIRENILPIVTDDIKNTKKTTAPLQSYEGDLLIQGRFGNTFRLGSTIKTTDYTKAPTWSGAIENDPLIILANKNNNSTAVDVENIQTDKSSLYLTTTQKINNIKLSKPLSKSGPVNTYARPQCIISADRVILQAKTDNVIIDAKRRVTINSQETRIGSEGASIPIPKGDILQQIINLLIQAIQSGVTGPAGIYSATNGTSQLGQALSLLAQLNSTNHYINK